MADIDEVMNRTAGSQQSGSSIREQMQREAAERRQQAQQAQQAQEQDDDYDEDVLEDDEPEEKGKLNLKAIIGIAAACLVVLLIVLMASAGKNRTKAPEEPVNDPVQEIPIEFDPIVEEPVTEPVIMANYTAEQMNNLRDIGITSEELNNYMQNNVPYDYVYNTLMERYWGWHLMNELPTYDMTSAEYKGVIDQTWMSLPERHDLAEWTTEYIAYSYDVEANLDYEKVTPYGNQLFLKIYLDDNTHDSWFFLNIKPEEWNMLGDRGNVVVNYKYQTHYKPYENVFDAEEDTDNIFITEATLNIIKSDFAISGQNSSDGTTQ